MKFSLVRIVHEKDDFVDGVWLQDHIGTIETAIEAARATEIANSNGIVVAVVDDLGYSEPNYSLRTSLKRLDSPSLNKAIDIINDFVREEYGSERADFEDLRKINLAFTETEDGKHDIQVDVNLIDFSIIKSVDKSVVEVVKYGSLAELIKNELEGMSFDDLVYLTDKQLAPFYEKSVPEIEDVKFSTLVPGVMGDALDSLFEKNNWTLQFWNNDKSTGYQVYFGEGVQVDNLYEYGFPYLYDKDDVLAFAKDFFVKNFIREGSVIVDEVFSALGYTDFAERVSFLFEEENRFFDYAWTVSKPNQSDPATKDYIAFWDQGNSWCEIFGVYEGITPEKFLDELKNIQHQQEQGKPKLSNLIESAAVRTTADAKTKVSEPER